MTAGTLPRMRPAALAAVRSPVFMAVAAAAAIAVLVRAPFFFWPLISDEGGYAYTAYWWFRGLTLYSDELWFDKPQGIFVVYKLGSLLFGDATWAIRLWGALWAAGTTVAVWLVARRLLDRHAAVVAALLYAVFSAHTHIEGFTANAETFMVLPATLSAYFLLRGQPLAAGLMASAAVVLKPSGGSAVLLGVAWLAYLRADRGAWLRFLLAGLSLPLVSVLHGALTAGPREYLDAVVLQRINTPRPNPFVAARRVWLVTLPLWAPLALLARFGIPRLMRRERVFLLLWLASALAGMALGGNWWEHYFIQLMPPLTVAAAPGLVYLWRSTAVRRWTAIALLLAPVYVAAAFVRPGPELGSWVLFRRDAYLVAEDAAAYIRERTARGRAHLRLVRGGGHLPPGPPAAARRSTSTGSCSWRFPAPTSGRSAASRPGSRATCCWCVSRRRASIPTAASCSRWRAATSSSGSSAASSSSRSSNPCAYTAAASPGGAGKRCGNLRDQALRHLPGGQRQHHARQQVDHVVLPE